MAPLSSNYLYAQNLAYTHSPFTTNKMTPIIRRYYGDIRLKKNERAMQIARSRETRFFLHFSACKPESK